MVPNKHAVGLIAGLALGTLFATSTVQAARPRIYAITGARIVTAPGKVIANGTIIMRDGLIEAVGPRVTVPADAELIAAQPGWTVYPAFIDAAAGVGLGKEAKPAAPAGGTARSTAEPKRKGVPHELESVHPEDDILERIDFSDAGIARHRALGFAVAQVLPDKGVFRGESAVILLRPGADTGLVMRHRAAQVVALETSSFMQRKYPSSKFGAVATVRQVLLDARRQGEWNARYQANAAGMPAPEFRSSDAALLRVLDQGQSVVWVSMIGLDPGRFGNLAREFGLHGMTVARSLGDRAQDLRAADMPVLLPLEMPEKPDVKGEDALVETSLEKMQLALRAPKLPAALAADRVKLAFVTLGMKNPGSFPQSIAAIVKAGFPADAALAAVTTTPAELLGLSRSMGSLEPGKQANLLVVDGELFADKPALRYVFVEGYPEKIDAGKAAAPPPNADAKPLDQALAVQPYPAPEPTPGQVLIRHATVWTMTPAGILEDADLLLDKGRIAAIGRGLAAQPGALVIDGTGRHVTPGIIDAHSHSATEQLDLNEGVNSISAEVRVRDVLDPHSTQIYHQLAGGVTLAHVLHGSGNAIGGQNAIVKYRWGVTRPDELVFEGAQPTIKFALGENPTQAAFKGMPGSSLRYPATRMGVAAFVRSSFEQAKQYQREWEQYNALSKGRQARTVPPRRDLRLEPLVEVLQGRRDVHSHSYRADEILMLMRLGEETGFRVRTFEHVLEGYRVADEMVAHGATGSTFSDWWSFKMEAYEAIPWNAAIMAQRGVLVSLNSDNADLARRLNLEAAKMRHYGGLGREQALAMVTINPAQQLRIDEHVGSLARGKDADVVVWSGDPLSVYSHADMTFVDGQLRFSRERDLAHRAEVTAARARLAAELRGTADKDPPAPAAATAGNANPPAPQFTYHWAKGAPATPVAIVGATVHTLEGPAIADGIVVFADGRITAVGGPQTPVPAGAERVDARGKHLWPSLIHLSTVLGISEIDSVPGTVDVTETGEINADADAAVAVNAGSEHFPVARSGGIGHALVVPSGGLVSGTTTLLRTAGWTWEEMTAVRQHSLAIRWPEPPPPLYAIFTGPPKNPAEARKDAEERTRKLDELLDGAEAYGRAKRAAGAHGGPREYDAQLEALQPVVRGERPLWATAREKAAIETVVNWAARRKLRLVITDARDAYLVTDLLAQHQVPVVISGLPTEPPRPDDPYDVLYSLPAKLQQAGVLFAIGSSTRTGGSANARYISLFAGLAAAFGLDREDAYRAVTLNPARILGLDGVLGSIATGKSASLALTDGDLLEPSTTVEQIWIDGTRPSMDDVQKQAWRKWGARPK